MLINGFPSKAAKTSGAGAATPLFLSFLQSENTDILDAALGKNNESEVGGIGKALAMYAWFKGDSKAEHPFANLSKCDTLENIFNSAAATAELKMSANLASLIKVSDYAHSKYVEIVNDKRYLFKPGVVNEFIATPPDGQTANADTTVCDINNLIVATRFSSNPGSGNFRSQVTLGANIDFPPSLYKHLAIVVDIYAGSSGVTAVVSNAPNSVGTRIINLIGRKTEENVRLTGNVAGLPASKIYIYSSKVTEVTTLTFKEIYLY